MYSETIESSVGPLTIAADASGLRFLLFGERKPMLAGTDGSKFEKSVVLETEHQLRLYFDGKLHAFDLPLNPEGSLFQVAVWRELQKIPYGAVITYGELARRIGKPKASRAVGAANGSNPISIVIPCHRVIGSNGKMTGYGGGVPIKEALLKLENARLF